jgi:hypothetical protein
MNSDITGWFTTEEGNHVPIHGNQTKKQAIEQHFGNAEQKASSNSIPKSGSKKEQFFGRIQEQTGVDLRKYQETGYGLDRKRGYVSIHLEDATPQERQRVLEFVAKKNIRYEQGGGLGDTFYL